MVSGLQNEGLSFPELMQQAEEATPIPGKLGKGMLDDLRTKHPGAFEGVEFELGPTKTIERARAIINGDYAGNHQIITDLTRGRIVVNTPEQVRAVREHLKNNF